MRTSLRRLFLPAVCVCLSLMIIRHFLPTQHKPHPILNLLEFVDVNGELTESFKEELLLKHKILQEEAAGEEEEEEEEEEKSQDNYRIDIDTAEIGNYIEGSTWYTAEVNKEKNVPDDVLAMTRPKFLPGFKNPCWREHHSLSALDSPSSNSSSSSRIRCLPYFHLMGVDKSGTTDLWYRLAQHPHLVRPKAVMGKETHWWSWRRFGFDIWVKNREIRHFDWYLQHFDDPSKRIEDNTLQQGNERFYHHFITGEGSPTVFWDFTGWNLIPQNTGKTAAEALLTPDCIKHLIPDAKFIVLFRNPTDRLYSDYLFLDQFKSHHNVSVLGFHLDVRRSLAMLTGCFAERSETECLLDKELHMVIPVRLIVGLYDFFLEKWLKVFPSRQILVLRSEDYSKDVRFHVTEVYKFLGLETLSSEAMERITNLPKVFEKSASARSLGPMMQETRDLLNSFYHRYNDRLAVRLNNTAYLWR